MVVASSCCFAKMILPCRTPKLYPGSVERRACQQSATTSGFDGPRSTSLVFGRQPERRIVGRETEIVQTDSRFPELVGNWQARFGASTWNRETRAESERGICGARSRIALLRDMEIVSERSVREIGSSRDGETLFCFFFLESIYNTPPTRAVTRTLAKISGGKKDDQQESKPDEGGEGADGEQAEAAPTSGAGGDAEATISQILAQQTGAFLQWPKERAIIFRLQNICHLIEKGEWPTPRAYTLLDTAMGDQGSSTPDTPAADTPGPCDLDMPGSSTIGQNSSSISAGSRKDQQSAASAASAMAASMASAFGLPLTATGALKLDTFNDLAAAAAAAAFPLSGAIGLGSVGRQQQQTSASGRNQQSRGGAGRGRKRRHPLHDLVESERGMVYRWYWLIASLTWLFLFQNGQELSCINHSCNNWSSFRLRVA